PRSNRDGSQRARLPRSAGHGEPSTRRTLRRASTTSRHRPGARDRSGCDLCRRTHRRARSADGRGSARDPHALRQSNRCRPRRRDPRSRGCFPVRPGDSHARRPHGSRRSRPSRGYCGNLRRANLTGERSMNTFQLWSLLRKRSAGRSDPQKLTSFLAVIAFAVTTSVTLIVLGGWNAFAVRGENATGDEALYPALAATASALLLIPLSTLGAAAARLAMARRDERLAALRLAGATTRKVSALTLF